MKKKKKKNKTKKLVGTKKIKYYFSDGKAKAKECYN